jgi:rhamnose transport system permease protein
MERQKISNLKAFSWKKFFLQWEWMLFIIFILINILNTSLSSNYLNFSGIMRASMNFLDQAFIVFSMAFVIMLGDIDISVGSIVALGSVVMAVLFNAGVPMAVAMVICVALSTLCGFINGWLLIKFKEISAVIVTLATMIFYRGIAYMILEDQAAGGFPKWFSYLSWGKVGTIPFILIMFIVVAVIFTLLLHKTKFGRRLYGMGNNAMACRFSGVQVDRIKVIVFTINGLMSGICALFLASKMMSTRPNVASGYELDVIAMAVLGGVSTAGGKGRMIGVIIAVFILGLLRYGLGLINASSQVIMIITGLLLIVAVSIPSIQEMVGVSRAKKLSA